MLRQIIEKIINFLEVIWFVVAIIFSVWVLSYEMLSKPIDLSTIIVTILGYTTAAIIYLGLVLEYK